jgi:chromate transporter
MGRIGELVRLFLRLGLTAFGGPAVHVARIREEVVDRLGWMSERELTDLFAATQLIPGPNSTELAIHVGRERAGWKGAVAAGVAFIAPAAAMMWALALLYSRHGDHPAFRGFLAGAKPVVIAVVLQAIVTLGRSLARGPVAMMLAAGAAAAAWLGVDELLLLLLAGMLSLSAESARKSGPLALALPLPGLAAIASWKPLSVFAIFLKIGSVCFGSGYVLLAFLRGDLVDRLGWVTEPQLLDAVAIGQITPGPVFTAATFLGTLVAGHAGAVAATVGIFLPAFVFVLASARLLARLRASRRFGAFLSGLNAASLGLMAATLARMASSAIVDARGIALAAGSFALLLLGVSSQWLLLGAGAIGALLGP